MLRVSIVRGGLITRSMLLSAPLAESLNSSSPVSAAYGSGLRSFGLGATGLTFGLRGSGITRSPIVSAWAGITNSVS